MPLVRAVDGMRLAVAPAGHDGWWMPPARRLDGLRTTAVTLLAAVMLGGCSQRPPSVPEIPREVVGTHEGFRSGVPTSNNPPRR